MRNFRSHFMGLFFFLAAVALVLSNGFGLSHIRAADNQVDIYNEIEPISVVLDEILKNYVDQPDMPKVVEGALVGMMNSLDDHSSFIPATVYDQIINDTEGEFEGIGVKIQTDDQNIVVFQPIAGSPASKAGLMSGDILVKIDDVSTKGISIDEAAKLIRGPRGTIVHLKVLRRAVKEGDAPQLLDLEVTRDTIPLESIIEARVLDGGVGYMRISDFKKTTSHDMAERIKALEKEGMRSLIIDLRWNPGGLLTAAKEVSELFLPKNSMVTYTKGRKHEDGTVSDEMTLYTEHEPVIPAEYPIVLLVNGETASSSEIVTGALQFYQRAIVIGQKTYGKGSVQTIIPLAKPKNSALRLTTALYYTPADVTINKHGILPDVDAAITEEQEVKLFVQLRDSFEKDKTDAHKQNHGSVSGDEMKEGAVDDVQLKKAVELLKEDNVWANLVKKYHKDTKVTQVAATQEELDKGKPKSASAQKPAPAQAPVPSVQ